MGIANLNTLGGHRPDYSTKEKARRERSRTGGICIRCHSKQAVSGGATCEGCRSQMRAYSSSIRNPEEKPKSFKEIRDSVGMSENPNVQGGRNLEAPPDNPIYKKLILSR